MSDFRTGVAWRDAGAYVLKLRHTGTPNVGGGEGAMPATEVSFTLSCRSDQTLFCRAGTQANSEEYEELCPCMARRQHKDAPIIYGGDELTRTGYVVRRLTPLECERLQGFPDGWTDIRVRCVRNRKTGGYDARPVEETPDAPRYKAMGNSMAVPCMAWIGRRIQAVEDGERDGAGDAQAAETDKRKPQDAPNVRQTAKKRA